MPTKRIKINHKTNKRFYYIMYSSILYLDGFSILEQNLVAYFYGLLTHNREYNITQTTLKKLFSRSSGNINVAMKKLVEYEIIRVSKFDGRNTTYTRGEQFNILEEDIQKYQESLSKNSRQHSKKGKHIIKDIDKTIKENEKEKMERIVDEILLGELKEIYLGLNLFPWDEEHDHSFPELIEKIVYSFFKKEEKFEMFGSTLKELFSYLIRCKTRFTKSVPSYNRIYGYWIDAICKDKSREEAISRIIYKHKPDSRGF